ncbi:MAG: hypothetical protein IKU17_00560 [Clostridia bacterium]|nr:hypothetical protein [Clostridia bacterium]
MKKKLLILCAQVLVISCLAGCERVPYWPTPWDLFSRALPHLQEIADFSLRVELTFTLGEETHGLQIK